MQFDEDQGERYQDIVEFLSPPDNEPTSSAKLEKELEGDKLEIREAVMDLVAFGELELININQAARVRLHKSATPSTTTTQTTLQDLGPSTWHAYITAQGGTGRTRARRLFDNRSAAEAHLTYRIKADSLTPVPGISNVWCETTYGYDVSPKEYAVLRAEPVYSKASDPHPDIDL